jgi:hypothetical protein
LVGVRRFFLVSCVKRKGRESARAAELYTSSWFVKARSLVEATGAPWFILSAEHGLVAPSTVIAPYEKTLRTMSVAERQAWAERVTSQLEVSQPHADEVIVLAGKCYREHLMHWLRERYQKVTVPMDSLKQGQQLRWLTNVTSI